MTFKELPVGARFRQINHRPGVEWVKVEQTEATAIRTRHNAVSADGQRLASVGHSTKVAVPPYDDQPPPSQLRNARKQQARRSRMEQAAQRFDFDTIDQLTGAMLALSPEDAEQIKAILRKS